MKHAARLIPALLLATLAVVVHQQDPKHPARPWWDNHVQPLDKVDKTA